MPCQFPRTQSVNTVLTDANRLIAYKNAAQVSNANTPAFVLPSRPNIVNKAGVNRFLAHPNLRDLGQPYQSVTADMGINPVNVVVGIKQGFNRVMGRLNMTLSGVSRDSTGAALGNCQVLIFRTADKSFILETQSDGSGNWSVSMLVGGPFFLVEYKVGSPDVAGTSVNTLVPT